MIAPVVFLLGIAAWLVATMAGLPAAAAIAKPVPVLALAGWTWPARERWLTAGLVLSAVGDVVLEMGRANAFFLAGMAAFGLAHVAYVVAFVKRSNAPRLLAALPFVAWGALVLPRLWPGLGALRIPVTVYAMLLLVMMWRALASSIADRSCFAAAGAVVFGLSDSLLALERFAGPLPRGAGLVMATYWVAQYLIARSALARIKA